MPKKFAIIGAGGYIAPRHLRAVRDTGNNLIAAVDPKDSVGMLDQFGYDISFFLLLCLFGPAGEVKLYHADDKCMSRYIELEKNDFPDSSKRDRKTTYRSITVDGQEIEFSGGFTDLHTRVYEETLVRRGFGLQDARPSIALTHRIRTSEISPIDSLAYPKLSNG